MQRTQIYLPTTQLKLLQKNAQSTGTTVSAVIRSVIQEYFVKAKPAVKSKPHVDLVAMAKRVNAISAKKGPKDLASRVDHYLYGSI